MLSHEITIQPPSKWPELQLGELWQHRELLYYLAWRDIKVRYKQTVLGCAWVILQPVMMTLAFYVCFHRVANVTSAYPYALFVLCGLAPWQLFAHALTQSSSSLVANERLLTKVYFPRLLIPLSTVVAGLADFAISLTILSIALLAVGVRPGWTVLFVPVFVAMAIMAALAVGLWLAALTLRYRDVRYTITFLAQFWLLATPIAYPSSVVPARWRVLFGLNPMTGVVEGFRWALLREADLKIALLITSSIGSILLLCGALYYFRRMESYFADLV